MRCANKDYIIEHYYDDVKRRDAALDNIYQDNLMGYCEHCY